MPHKVEIHLPRRRWWLLGRKRYRRDLPASWMEVEPARRLPLLRTMLAYPGALGRLKALQQLLNLPTSIFRALDDDQACALLEQCGWLDLNTSATPVIDSFVHRGVRYYLPSAYGLNLVALEYPIADKIFEEMLSNRFKHPLEQRLLCAVLAREANPDEAMARTRGDMRVPIYSRAEAEHRARLLDGVPEEVLSAVLLYFAGVKEYVHRAYGEWLFSKQETDDDAPASTSATLGWWGLYFNLATDGPFGRNVKEVYQASFHDVCLYLVDQRRREAQRKMQERLQSREFAEPNP